VAFNHGGMFYENRCNSDLTVGIRTNSADLWSGGVLSSRSKISVDAFPA